MKKEQVLELFPLLGSKPVVIKPKWVEGPCPFAIWEHQNGKDSNPSFGIKSDPLLKSRAKCFACGFSGDLMDLIIAFWKYKDRPEKIKLEAALQLVANEFAADQEPDGFDKDIPDYGDKQEKGTPALVYPESWLQTFKSVLMYPNAIKYLRSRGITKQLAKDLDVRYDPLQSRVCFPFRDFANRLMGVQGRYCGPDPSIRRYHFYDYGGRKNLHVWLGEHHLDLDKPVVTVEGPFDYASVRRVYSNVVASFSAGIGSYKIRRLADAVEVVSFYDFGKGGDAARKALRKALPKMPITDVIPPDEEFDPGKMSIDMLEDYLGPHLKLQHQPS